jgi:hypothetical protein
LGEGRRRRPRGDHPTRRRAAQGGSPPWGRAPQASSGGPSHPPPGRPKREPPWGRDAAGVSGGPSHPPPGRPKAGAPLGGGAPQASSGESSPPGGDRARPAASTAGSRDTRFRSNSLDLQAGCEGDRHAGVAGLCVPRSGPCKRRRAIAHPLRISQSLLVRGAPHPLPCSARLRLQAEGRSSGPEHARGNPALAPACGERAGGVRGADSEGCSASDLRAPRPAWFHHAMLIRNPLQKSFGMASGSLAGPS